MNTWGNKLKLSIFGQSHGAAVGIVVDGLPAGEAIDEAAIARDMQRRAPGRDDVSTSRSEADAVEIISGIYQNKTAGSPVCGLIYNRDARSADYDTHLRPGHADWTALLKHDGHADMRGGGHFSGRLTAPLVFAGSMAKQILQRRGVEVFARIAAIGDIQDPKPPETKEAYQKLAELPFSAMSAKEMRQCILDAKAQGDSIGGIVEAVAFGVPGGLGEPFFGSMESVIASMLFSIPAVKGVAFGDGFSLAAMCGSEANDAILINNDVETPSLETIITATNHNGGVLGGITNGMPLIVRAAIKPTPSIGKQQKTVDAATLKSATFSVRGRHDPCIVPRAVPVVEAALALCILDSLLTDGRFWK